METNKMTRQQKVTYLKEYAAGKREEKEIDYSKFTDNELRWLAALQDKTKVDGSFDETLLTEDEREELQRLEEKIIWK